jgi:transposase-like protein
MLMLQHRGTRAARRILSPQDRQSIAERAQGESLRAIARDYGVSQETVRSALVQAGYASLLEDKSRSRQLALAGPPPPPAPRKVPVELYGDVVACRERETQAEVAARFGVSQATVWRICRTVMTGSGRGER